MSTLLFGCLFRAAGALGSFARSSVRAPPSGTFAPLSQVWPIPPSSQALGPLPQRGGRRRHGRRLCSRIDRHSDAAIIYLNFLALGSLPCAPVECFAGRPRSPEQARVCEFLRRSISTWFSDPPVGDTLFPKIDALVDSLRAAQSLDINTSMPPPVANAASSFRKAIFMKSDSNCYPSPFLHPLSMACYLEPRLLRIPPLHSLHATLRDAFRDRTYYEPSKAPGGLFQHGADEDILSYFKQWDAHRRLLLLTPSETSRAAWGELFEVPKSQEATRVVFNRISQNFTEVHLATASSTIPPGFALCDLHLDSPTSVARIHTDDVVDFYPAFLGSDVRGRTNVVGKTFPLTAFAGTAALRDFAARRKMLGLKLPGKVVAANKGLVMGDVNATDFAIEAHGNLLESSGAILGANRILNKHPLPRSDIVQGLVVDDHFAISVGEEDAAVHDAPVLLFDVGRQAYSDVGLQCSDS